MINKYHLQDFDEYEMLKLRTQFGALKTIPDLCYSLLKSRKAQGYPLVYRVVTLILTLRVSTATTKCSFSAINMLCDKMEVNFIYQNDAIISHHN